jgi:hypothetical protein
MEINLNPNHTKELIPSARISSEKTPRNNLEKNVGNDSNKKKRRSSSRKS